LLQKVDTHRPEVTIIDIRMPPTHTDEGLQAAAEIRRRHPDVGIMILSQHVEVGVATRLLAESAAGIGYLLKDRVTNFEDFTAALRRVPRGGSVLDPNVVSQLLSAGGEADDPLAELTRREREVIALVAEGRSNKGIGQRLFITERAVQKHVTSIFMKLGLPHSDDDHRRILAVLAYVRS
jgi:DNA-binding NarL/FixJ family response regulator